MRNRVFVVVLGLLASLFGVTGAQADVSYPELAGRTTITSRGTAGVTFRVPSLGVLEYQNIRVQLSAGRAAYVAMGPPAVDGYCGALRNKGACVTFSGWLIPEWDNSHTLRGWTPSEIHPGLFEVYVVSDGDVTLTFDVQGLAGSVSVEATAQIDGVVEALPRSCPVGDCSVYGHGGAMHVVRAPAIVSVVGYAVPEPYPSWGVRGVGICIYPSYSAASPDPSDHPTGCDHAYDADSLESLVHYGVDDLNWALNPRISGAAKIDRWKFANGAQYLGYWANSVTLPGEGRYGAFGVWLSMGQTCPSADFTSC